jgi:hypothetical protein
VYARRTTCLAVALAILATANRARALEPTTTTLPAPPPPVTFAYVSPAEKHYLRATLELSAVMLAGAVQYATEKGNSTDWDLGYDWPSLRAKLTGDAVRFDTNRFDTNMITHPAAGALYYVAARGNRLSVLESFLFAAAASTTWEYVGEFREKASVNDLIVTPVAGAVVGETLTQLGVFFERSERTPVTRVLAFVLAPTKTTHDWIDGATPARSVAVDDLGLTTDESHRFELSAGGVMTSQDRGPTWGDVRLALRTEVVNASAFDRAGRASEWLLDGNVSSLDAEAQLGRVGLADFQLDLRVAPVAFATRSLALTAEGDLAGQRLLMGLTAGFDYGVHRYDRTHPEEMDWISGVHAFGLLVAHDLYAPPFHVRTSLGMRPEFAAVRALAVDEFIARHGIDSVSLPTVVNQESYYFAFGANLTPEVEVSMGPVSVGALGRFDTYWSIEGIDRYQEKITGELALHDRRALGRAWLGVQASRWLTFRVGVDRRVRNGQIADASAARAENALWASAGTVF